MGEGDDEFVAAKPGHGVFVPHAALQPLGDGLQQQVANAVAESVVDRLELIEVQKQQSNLGSFPLPLGDGTAQAVVEQGAIGQTGEGVVIGQLMDFPLGLVAGAQVDGNHQAVGGAPAQGAGGYGREQDVDFAAVRFAQQRRQVTDGFGAEEVFEGEGALGVAGGAEDVLVGPAQDLGTTVAEGFEPEITGFDDPAPAVDGQNHHRQVAQQFAVVECGSDGLRRGFVLPPEPHQQTGQAAAEHRHQRMGRKRGDCRAGGDPAGEQTHADGAGTTIEQDGD